MVERLKTILEQAFPGIGVSLEQLNNGRIAGSAVWDGFAGIDQLDRQNKLRETLQKELAADVTQVGVILTYTPDELYAMKAA